MRSRCRQHFPVLAEPCSDFTRLCTSLRMSVHWPSTWRRRESKLSVASDASSPRFLYVPPRSTNACRASNCRTKDSSWAARHPKRYVRNQVASNEESESLGHESFPPDFAYDRGRCQAIAEVYTSRVCSCRGAQAAVPRKAPLPPSKLSCFHGARSSRPTCLRSCCPP